MMETVQMLVYVAVGFLTIPVIILCIMLIVCAIHDRKGRR
jgi:hypothetical protein